MERRRIIRTDIAASAIAHLTLVALIVVISEVHPFHAPPTETVSVDIVTPEELKETAPEPAPPAQLPLPDLSTMTKTEGSNAAPPPVQAPSASPPQQPPPSPPQQKPSPAPSQREANAQPQAQPARPAVSFSPPEPDITVKYGVMLGLPETLPPLPKDSPKDNDDGGDAKDSVSAKLPAEVVAELRRHLKSCAKLPASIAPSDNVRIKLRAVMTTDGLLGRPPILIEASASAKGPILMQAAKSALEACQPYTMLPADKYQEWKVLDLTFTPRDFSAS